MLDCTALMKRALRLSPEKTLPACLLIPAMALCLVLARTGACLAEDAVRGERLFKKCAVCHQLDPAMDMKLGPPLNAVFLAPAAAIEGFDYSAAMRQAAAAGLHWTAETLDAYIANPRRFLPKTKMVFAGLRRSRDRKDIIAFLEQAALAGGPQIAGFAVSPEILAIKGDPEYGEYLASECVTCHKADGADEGIPAITDLSVESFVTAMHSYREDHREHPVMQMIANRLSNDEIAALAAYFAEAHH